MNINQINICILLDGPGYNPSHPDPTDVADAVLNVVPNPIAEGLTSISEWLGQFLIDFKYQIASGLYNAVSNLFVSFNSDLNMNIRGAANLASTDFSSFAGGQLYSKVMNASRVVFTPIAAIIFSLVFAWEFCQMVEQSNRSGDKPLYQVLTSLIKLVMCILLISHAMDIIMGCFKLGQWAAQSISGNVTGRGGSFVLSDFVTYPQQGVNYPMSEIIKLIQMWFMLMLGRGAILVISLLVYLKVIVWFIEFAIFAAPAAIPMATWLNRDWSQTGMNYVKKGLALAMEGPLMLFVFSLYGAITQVMTANYNSGNNDFLSNFVIMIGGAIIVYTALKKIPALTGSIFNAH